MSDWDQRETYRRWWVGKRCRIHSRQEWKRVIDVRIFGPPSFVYGSAELVFDDYTTQTIYCGKAFKPRKMDVEVHEGDR